MPITDILQLSIKPSVLKNDQTFWCWTKEARCDAAEPRNLRRLIKFTCRVPRATTARPLVDHAVPAM
jgi:hypothetical protein